MTSMSIINNHKKAFLRFPKIGKEAISYEFTIWITMCDILCRLPNISYALVS